VTGVLIGILAGLVTGIVMVAVFGAAVAVGTGVGIAVGVLMAVLTGVVDCFAETAWPWYEIARIWLALRHRLPWALMGFLADAHTRGVLRQAGAVYQFRHIELQHRLATRPSNPT
jgi:hypothetical protein